MPIAANLPSDAEVSHPPFALRRLVRSRRGLPGLAAGERDQLRWSERLLRLPLVWRQSKGEGVKVAILDTGIDPDHPDLAGAVAASRDFTGEGIEDRNGHGTHCAGIVGARENGRGFMGVAPRCRLLIGKVLRGDGGGRLDWLARGIDWAVGEGADIISMSLGAPRNDPAVHRAVHDALAAGRILVCAAGNAGSLYRNSIAYPGRYASVITVAAHDRNGNPSGFSSRGAELDFMAPGEDIWSTWREGGYAKLSGTSMATPFVAGICALVLAKHREPGEHATPIANNEDMRHHLLRMAAHPGHHDEARGHGPLLPFMGFAEAA